MKVLSQINKRSLVLLVVLACLMVLSSVSAFAQTKAPVLRETFQGETHIGRCCTSWDDSVRIAEPEKIAPIVVTFSTDYQSTASFFVGLKLNDGPCAFYGPAFIPAYAPADFSDYSSKTFQWVIMPGDYKLVQGRNEIKLCGGGVNSDTGTLTLGFHTLTAHLQK